MQSYPPPLSDKREGVGLKNAAVPPYLSDEGEGVGLKNAAVEEWPIH